jgi:hypothetical protein
MGGGEREVRQRGFEAGMNGESEALGKRWRASEKSCDVGPLRK